MGSIDKPQDDQPPEKRLEGLVYSENCDELGTLPHTELNAGTSDPTDGRAALQWKSAYPQDAKLEIRYELLFLVVVLLSAHTLIFVTWVGWLGEVFALAPNQVFVFKKYAYYSSAGLLGGIVFGIKYFYRLVARGYWHQDRRIWRLMSPFVSMTVALVLGAMIESSLIAGDQQKIFSGARYVSIGFLAGYFADQAVGKMYEIARVVFGTSATSKKYNDERKN